MTEPVLEVTDSVREPDCKDCRRQVLARAVEAAQPPIEAQRYELELTLSPGSLLLDVRRGIVGGFS